MYYLQSRYYDPVVGRFINADTAQHMGGGKVCLGYNLLTFCENNPVSNTDPFGHFSWAIFGDLIKRIAELTKELLMFILEKYGLTKNLYAKRKKFKRANSILVFVNENKNAIKTVKATVTGIGHVIDIVLTVADYAIMLKGNRSTMVKIADTLFYGIIRIIGYMGSKLISWLVSKIIKVLCWAKFFIELVLNTLLDAILNSKWVEKLKEKYLTFIEAPGITFGDYIVAIFKGAKACVA